MPAAPLPLPVAMLIVFGSAKLMAELFSRLRLPSLAGEIVAGILIGPGVLGWIAPNEVLRALSDLGVLFLLFSIGLEIKISDLLRVSAIATFVAALGELVPFLAGWGILLLWGASRNEAVFVGAALVATSVGITASVLSARNLLNEGASQIILAAAVIDDVLGLVILAIVSGMASGHIDAFDLLVTAALATAFMVVTAVWGTKVVRRLLPSFQSRARADEAAFHIALLLLFALSALALYAGMAAIVGAFLAGLALAGNADRHVRDLTRGVSEFLVPFFLVGVGLNFDPAIFRSRRAAELAGMVLLAAVISKLMGCAAGAISLGWREALRVGVGMVPRGEVAMIAAQLGLTTAVLHSTTYSVIVFVVVGTAVLTPPLLDLAFHSRGDTRLDRDARQPT